MEMESSEMGILPHDRDPGVCGAIVLEGDKQPSGNGTLVYQNDGVDLTTVLNRVEAAGGAIRIPKTPTSPARGFFSFYGWRSEYCGPSLDGLTLNFQEYSAGFAQNPAFFYPTKLVGHRAGPYRKTLAPPAFERMACSLAVVKTVVSWFRRAGRGCYFSGRNGESR